MFDKKGEKQQEMCNVTNVAGFKQEQEGINETEEIRLEEAHDYVLSVLSRFPTTEAERWDLFECFGLDVSKDTADNWMDAYYCFVSGRLGGYVWHLVLEKSQSVGPSLFDTLVRGPAPELAKYIQAVYDGDRKLARWLAKEQSILEQCAPPRLAV